MTTQQRKQAAVALAGSLPVGDQAGQLRAVLEEPFQARGKLGQPLQRLGFQNLIGKQRGQSNDGTNFQSDLAAIRKNQLIVIKLVGFVPQTILIQANTIDRTRDGEEVLEKLRGDVFVRVSVQRQFERNAQEVQAVHGHPARAVRLVDEAAARQRAAIECTDVVKTEKATLKDVAPLCVLA